MTIEHPDGRKLQIAAPELTPEQEQMREVTAKWLYETYGEYFELNGEGFIEDAASLLAIQQAAGAVLQTKVQHAGGVGWHWTSTTTQPLTGGKEK